jgi:Ca2+-binding RTX toxin-like protein
MRRALLLAALLVALVPGAAPASTVGIETRQYPDPEGDGCSRYFMCDYQAAVLRAADGETNVVTVADVDGGKLFKDTGATLTPGTSCQAVEGGVLCPQAVGVELFLGDGDDTATTETGGTIEGESGNDTLTARGFGSQLRGGDGNDTLAGSDEDDSLNGGAGTDVLRGGDGLDSLDGGDGADDIDGGAGPDTLSYTSREAAVTVDLTRGTGGEAGEGDRIAALETVYGGSGDDVLRGDAGAQTFWGFSGDDVLTGRGGSDDLDGDRGDDVLRGGPGRDALDGGSGNDRLFSRDGVRDRVNGGSGRDTARADRRDRLRRVERRT